MPDYQKGKIYKIVCNITNEVYYGSTCNYLSSRKAKHNADVKRYDNNNKSGKCKSYDIIKRGDWGMFLVENYPCNNKDELRMRERYYIENNECVNKLRSIISKEEHKELKQQSYERNKEEISKRLKERRVNRTEEELLKDKQSNKENYEKNKERYLALCKARREGEKREEILAKKREYHHNNKEMIATKNKAYREGDKREEILEKKKEYYRNNKEMIAEKNKAYREQNKEKTAEINKLYYERNKEIIAEKNKERMSQIVICSCGCEVTRGYLGRHLKSQKHIKLMEAQKQ